ncbi:MAG: hypothetical protein ACRD0U_09825, partial [Acidimicrobiales bacterium]
YEVEADGDEVVAVLVPGIPIPIILPIPIPVPVPVNVNVDSGDSGTTRVDRRVFVSVDIDNRRVVQGGTGTAERTAETPRPRRRYGQRIAATLAFLALVLGWIALGVAWLRFRRRKREAGP